jgi:DoxX
MSAHIGAYAATAGYVQSAGVPGALLPAVIALEILGAIALILGWQTRITAFLLAGFTLLAGILFHNNFADPTQWVMFLKNFAIAGGCCCSSRTGQVRLVWMAAHESSLRRQARSAVVSLVFYGLPLRRLSALGCRPLRRYTAASSYGVVRVDS